MAIRILLIMMVPFMCLGQITPSGNKVNNGMNEPGNAEIKRKTSFNLEEIKVRWKKVALENCLGVPCVIVTVPGDPTGVSATAGNASASVAFTAPTNNGGSAVTGYIVTSNPGSITGTGPTSPINLSGLMNGTAYTFTVVATNAIGNSVASTASTPVAPVVACGTITSVTDADNNLYSMVSIGTQCWMASNLKVTKYNDGITPIPLDNSVGTAGTWTTQMTGAYTIYDNEPSTGSNATYYGFLYNWYAAKGITTTGSTTYKNICPTGFHVPTDSDWNKLVKFIDSGADTSSTSSAQSSTAGTKLKKNDALWLTNTGTDDYGFSGLPGGVRSTDGSFLFIRNNNSFWSATENPAFGAFGAWQRSLNHLGGNVNRGTSSKLFGFSVRCLKD